MNLSEIVDVLENCELFRGLERDEIEKIASLGTVETYQTGENILNQGDFGENWRNSYVRVIRNMPKTYKDNYY
jgi:signal-transduction protein with cAMP-binding, CBS, and nucleotidyltransferase domain